MKKLILPLSLTLGVGLTACGPMNQDPLADYPNMKNHRPVMNANDLVKQEPQKQEVVVIKEVPKDVERIVYVDREKPVIQEKIVYVEKEKAVEKAVYYPKEAEANYAAAQLFQITTNQNLSFVAGVESKIPFEVRMLQGEVDFTASLLDMPHAQLKEVGSEGNKKNYQLIFKPAVDMIAGESREVWNSLKIQLNIKSVKDKNADKQKRLIEALKVVSTMKSFDYVVRRDYSNPKLTVNAFPSQILEGQKQSFTIKVTSPGTYKGYQPVIYTTYDNKGLNGGNLFENSGVPFIRQTGVEKTGDNEWTFKFDLDTTVFAIPAQLDKNMQKITSNDVALRVSFQALSPAGVSSDVRVLQYKITYKQAATATAAAQ